ncbi:MAG TPA: hypothetical protein VGK24_05730 [Candidatus Angelobacter sp.]|jgi:hypothetical protein
MKFGDAVTYTENGQEFNAAVLGLRDLDHHVGENGEPLIHLAFFKETAQPVIGTSRQAELVQFRTDVAHESHAFSNEAREANRRNPLPTIYAGGRYREAGTLAISLTPHELAAKAAVVKVEEPKPVTPLNAVPLTAEQINAATGLPKDVVQAVLDEEKTPTPVNTPPAGTVQ